MSTIVHIDTVHPVDDTRIFAKECKSLAAKGHHVTLIACDSNVQLDPVENLNVVCMRPQTNLIRRLTLGQIAAFRQLRRIPKDIVHFHSAELIPAMLIYKLFSRSRVIFDMHENVVTVARSRTYIPRWLAGCLSLAIRYLLRLAEKIFDGIVIAEDSYQSILKTQATVVRNYPRIDDNRENDAAGTNTRESDHRDFRMVYFGSITAKRGLFTMLELIQILRDRGRDAALELLGPFGIGSEEEKARTLISKLGLNASVHCSFDRVSHEAGMTEICNSDVGLSLLQPEENYMASLPTKLFEYMLAGVPAIVSDFSLWRSIVEDANCGMTVDPSDAPSIADEVEKLIDNPDERRQLGKNGRKAVLTKYNWDSEFKKLESLYTSIMGQS